MCVPFYELYREHHIWCLIGQGLICRFQMRGHVDTSLSLLILDPPVSGSNFILLELLGYFIVYFRFDLIFFLIIIK